MSKEEGCSLFWLGLAILILIGSMRLSLGSLDNPGPGFLPFIAGLIMGVLAVIVYFQSRGATFSAKKIKGPLWTNPVAVKKVVFATLALFAYAVGMDYLGFLISTFIFFGFYATGNRTSAMGFSDP